MAAICDICGRDGLKNLSAHRRLAHPAPRLTKQMVEGDTPIDTTPLPGGKVRFTAPRNARLIVIVKPQHLQWMEHGGIKIPHTIPGKRAEFVNGVFETDDPEIIDYLENVYAPDPRNVKYPVVSQKILERIGKRT